MGRPDRAAAPLSAGLAPRTPRAWLALGALLSACDATLASSLPEAQANEMLVALDGHGIHAAKEAEAAGGDEPRFSVHVASGDVAGALAILRREGLPHAPTPGLHEMFGAGSLVPTQTEERARLVAALGGELSRSLEAIDGVLEARVHVSLPADEAPGLDRPTSRPRASVLIRHRGAHSPVGEDEVRRLVSGAIDAMEPDDVALVTVPVAPPPDAGAHLGRVGPFAVARGSVPGLSALLAALLSTNVLLAAGLAFFAFRARRPPPEGGPTDGPPTG